MAALKLREGSYVASIRKSQLGAAMIEYGLLLGGIALVAIVGIASLGDVAQDPFTALANPAVEPAIESPPNSSLPNAGPSAGGGNATAPPDGNTAGNPGSTPAPPSSTHGDTNEPLNSAGDSGSEPSSLASGPADRTLKNGNTSSATSSDGGLERLSGQAKSSGDYDSASKAGGGAAPDSTAASGGRGGARQSGAGQNGGRNSDTAAVFEQYQNEGIANQSLTLSSGDRGGDSQGAASGQGIERHQEEGKDLNSVTDSSEELVPASAEGDISWWGIAIVVLEVVVLGYLLWRLHCFFRQRMQRVQDRRWSGI